MKRFPKKLAVIAIVWAILNPYFLSLLNAPEGREGMPRLIHAVAKDLRDTVAAGDTAMVSVPAERLSNSARVLDFAAKGVNGFSSRDAFAIMLSSGVIIILSVCILFTRERDAKTAV
jgi:hypothetical protein